MINTLAYTLAGDEYYAPLASAADPGPRYAPTLVPPGWQSTARDVWTMWSRPEAPHVPQGWKIHVSAQLERAPQVLDTVAEICFAQRVPFKHLSARLFFLIVHHKHGHRAQAGKFCAIYPPDTETARLLLETLAEALREEDGPYVLSDRRFGESRTVHYRFGAFGGRSRLLADGTRQGLVLDGSGREAVDQRQPYFVLPDGITDPFVAEEPAAHEGSILIRHYEIVGALQPSNAGGTYKARDTRSGRLVFIKEARAHNGHLGTGSSAQDRLRHEYEMLNAVHAAAPGTCPEPVELFTEWEHDFLVTEFVEGDPLRTWISRSSALVRAGRTAEQYEAYFARARGVLRSLDASLDRLHALGLCFGDLSPGNLIVTATGEARLVDFETASATDGPPVRLGTPGFAPPAALRRENPDPLLTDRYGAAAIALAFLAPFHDVAERAPGNVAMLRHDLAASAMPPADLWARATAFHRTDTDAGSSGLPSPEDVDADPLGCLRRLAADTAAGLLATADTDRPDWVFPPPPQAFGTNTVCVAYGTAGVVHALHRAGVPIPELIEKRLRRDALALREELPPGLNVGTAGIARVLAALGHLDEAIDLTQGADDHPLTASCATLAGGRAGVGLTWLALHRLSRDARHLERAAAAGEAILALEDVRPAIGEHDARGLLHGRSGLALFLHQLSDATGEERYRAAGLRLLYEELDRTFVLDDGSRSIADNAVVKRAMPFLATGAAGVASVLTHYLAAGPDERLAAALPPLVAGAGVSSCTKEAGLYEGLAGLTWFLTEHADATGDAADRDTAVRFATGLVKYAIPHTRGVRFLGSQTARFSADLSSGAAGVLLALHRVLDGPGDDLFTLPHPKEIP
ncbi:class III lanthionine synthetase LanKC [Actinospica durhamensis]|uniref:Class III lanthionine synthetase LanKC n=1 Tax=Actinospica durhamensis TaxID=1508375 RepID=A0A941IMP4_9ACTN|nr:class III lanthionine synthetase LanKC [Actinospica durhamensis]MBR7833084.1 class III lanthionine synthetase LanKC [Actinospica durhamensis]